MNTFLRSFLGLALTAIALSSQLFAQQKTPAAVPPTPPAAKPPAAEDELNAAKSAAAFREAFDHGDAKAIAELWTPNGEYIDEDGVRFSGREAIEAEYAKFFAAFPKAKIRIAVDSFRLVSDAAAIEDGHSSIDPSPAGTPASSKYTAVHVKVDGKWLLASVRDTRVEVASSYDRLQDLEWMIGSWTAEEAGTTISMTLSWGPNKSFIERAYTVTKDESSDVAGGKQIIAWDPETECIQSWTFSSDGGRAIGRWTPHEGGWSIDTMSVQPDGSKASALNSFTKIDENGVVWRSTRRESGGVALPDLDEVVLRRVPAK